MPHRILSARVATHATVTADVAAIADLRDHAGPPGAPPLPPRFLRHADEHTVAAIRAVQEAIAAAGPMPDQGRFAIVAAPCNSGRPASARTLVGLRDGGGVTVSPHVVPQCSLHAIASAASVGLGIHGPNVGIGGGREALSEGLLAALAFLDEPGVSGCWLVLTAWDDEPTLDERGEVPADAVCRAVALALDRSSAPRLRLAIHPAAALAIAGGSGDATAGGDLRALSAALASAAPDRGRRAAGCDGCVWALRLSWGGIAHIELDAAACLLEGRGRRAA